MIATEELTGHGAINLSYTVPHGPSTRFAFTKKAGKLKMAGV